MKKVYCFFANGFEEIEGLTIVDLLRRVGIKVTMVSVEDTLEVEGAHGITIKTDIIFKDIKEEADMLMLPGGMPGTTNLSNHKDLLDMILDYNNKKRYLVAICAAPSVYGKLGILDGKRATSYPGFEKLLGDVSFVTDSVVVDGNIITSRGMGTSIDLGLKLVEILIDKKSANELKDKIIYK